MLEAKVGGNSTSTWWNINNTNLAPWVQKSKESGLVIWWTYVTRLRCWSAPKLNRLRVLQSTKCQRGRRLNMETLRLQGEFRRIRCFVCIGWHKHGFGCQDGRKVIWNNSASIAKWHLGHFGNRKRKKTQFGTMHLLFHDKGLLPPPAQFSPLLCLLLSIWWSKHRDHDPKWPHMHCGTEWPEGLKLRHPGAPTTLPGCRNPSIALWEGLNLQPGLTVPSLPEVQAAPRFLICSWSYHVRLERL